MMKVGLALSLLCALAGVSWSQPYTISTYAGGAAPPTPLAALNASVGGLSGVVTDAAGNVYFSSYLHCVFKLDTSGILTRVAGTCRLGYSGDGGQATSAQLFFPRGLALDSTGNLYIADSFNQRVRKVTPTGVITTVAGTGSAGYSGNGGPATSAQLNTPIGLAIDATGNLYIADTSNFSVRKVSTSGIITTIAGNGTQGYSGDGGQATSAQLASPNGLAVDASGNLYIADSNNYAIRQVMPDGNIETIAGSGNAGFSGDGGSARCAELNYVNGLAVDSAGTIYIADSFNSRIRAIAPNGFITTVAGTGTYGYSGDNGPATGAQVGYPDGLAVTSTGTLYIADGARLRRVTSGGVITTAAGNGNPAYSGDNGPATSAQLYNPNQVALDSSGNLYVADSGNNRVRKVTPAGLITTIAGNGLQGYSGDSGLATSAQLNTPTSVALDSTGNLYIADNSNYRVRRVTPGGVISTVAGNGTAGYSGDSNTATSAQISGANGLAVDLSGNLYIADTFNNRVRRVTPGGLISTVAGNGSPGYSGDSGAATSAQLNLPKGLAVDAAGNLYVADSNNHRIRKVTSGGLISTVAGNGGSGYSGDGSSATSAQLYSPNSVAVDAAGSLYIADGNNNRIRKVTSAGVITTIAGNGVGGYSGDGTLATSAQVGAPAGVAVDGVGRVYLASFTGSAVRLLAPSVIRADFNGDGAPDLIWQNDTTRQVSVWYLSGAQGNTFLGDAWLSPNSASSWRMAGSGDFNSDGKPDIVWQNDNTRQVSVWFMGGAQGNTYLGDAWLAQTGPLGWRVVGIADFNSDGKPDVVWQNDNTRQVSVWYMGGAQGTTRLSDAWLAQTGASGWRVVGIADCNGDGKPDLVWQNDTTRQVSVWYFSGAQGNTYLGDAWLAPNGPLGWTAVGLADFNGDAKPDLVWQNDSTRQVTVWYLGGSQGNTYLGTASVTSGAGGWTAIAR